MAGFTKNQGIRSPKLPPQMVAGDAIRASDFNAIVGAIQGINGINQIGQKPLNMVKPAIKARAKNDSGSDMTAFHSAIVTGSEQTTDTDLQTAVILTIEQPANTTLKQVVVLAEDIADGMTGSVFIAGDVPCYVVNDLTGTADYVDIKASVNHLNAVPYGRYRMLYANASIGASETFCIINLDEIGVSRVAEVQSESSDPVWNLQISDKDGNSKTPTFTATNLGSGTPSADDLVNVSTTYEGEPVFFLNDAVPSGYVRHEAIPQTSTRCKTNGQMDDGSVTDYTYTFEWLAQSGHSWTSPFTAKAVINLENTWDSLNSKTLIIQSDYSYWDFFCRSSDGSQPLGQIGVEFKLITDNTFPADVSGVNLATILSDYSNVSPNTTYTNQFVTDANADNEDFVDVEIYDAGQADQLSLAYMLKCGSGLSQIYGIYFEYSFTWNSPDTAYFEWHFQHGIQSIPTATPAKIFITEID